jgi:ParB-like nuclease family protein
MESSFGVHPAGIHRHQNKSQKTSMTLSFAPDAIEQWPLERLKPYAKNAKMHGPDQVAKIAASMAEFGWTVPCLVSDDGELIAGHGRVLAAEQLGLDEAPVIVLGHLSDEQRRAYRIADNKLTELGEWNEAVLSEELQLLAAEDFDLSLIGFDDGELDALLSGLGEETDIQSFVDDILSSDGSSTNSNPYMAGDPRQLGLDPNVMGMGYQGGFDYDYGYDPRGAGINFGYNAPDPDPAAPAPIDHAPSSPNPTVSPDGFGLAVGGFPGDSVYSGDAGVDTYGGGTSYGGGFGDTGVDTSGTAGIGSGDAGLGLDYTFGSDGNNFEDQVNDTTYPNYDADADNPGSTGASSYSAPSYGDPGARPIILDLDGDGVQLTELSRSTMFVDATGDGLLNRSAWAAAGNGVLFYDPDNLGAITEKRQYVFTEWDPTATSDMEALAAYFDSNGDGVLDASDAAFGDFMVMVNDVDGPSKKLCAQIPKHTEYETISEFLITQQHFEERRCH